jgi:hypothetical protein
MLTTIMHPMLEAMDGRGFRNFMIQLATTWSAFVLFLVALASL